MHLKFGQILFITNLLIINLVLIALVANDSNVSVTVKPRQFNGITKVIGNKVVNVFLGIPYARPPIGNLRFRKPVPLNNYDKPIDATQWPNPCMQRVRPQELHLYQNKNFSEDCLYLNIWSPNDSSNEINGETQQILKPVLFWIHGGALLFGSAGLVTTTGEALAAKGNVVVVTINYRLDYFGFLYSGTEDAPGNVGFWDQALALKWVNDNVEHFGGDRERITIFGNSAGGLCIGVHLMSPITRHLFRNAVVMSGSFHPYFLKDATQALNTLNIAKNFSCNHVSVSEIVNCLRSIPAEQFVSRKFAIETSVQSRPLYNEEFLPQNPIDMLKSGDFKRNANVLVGTVDDEGSGLLSDFYDNVTYGEINPRNLSKSEALVELKKLFSFYKTSRSNVYEDVYRLYISQIPENNYDLIRRSIGIAYGDYGLTCPTTRFAKLLFIFNKNANNAAVYQYMFSGGKKAHSWRGSVHMSDIPFWFGNVPESDVSAKMVDIISHFAYHGKPSQQEGIDWQSYYFIGEQLITTYYEIAEKANAVEGNYGNGYKYECEYLAD